METTPVYAWENIDSVTYRSEIIDGKEVIYPQSSNKGAWKTVDFETAMSKEFLFCDGKGDFYQIIDASGNPVICDEMFSILYDERLMVNMDFKGQSPSSVRPKSVNSQGWERSADKYFSILLEEHPDWFSTKNKRAIKSGQSPIIDEVFLKYFPKYRKFKNQTLIHHHAGEDGQAFALPEGVHVGEGGVHNAEKWLNIVSNAEQHSLKVQEAFVAGYIQAGDDVWKAMDAGDAYSNQFSNKFEYIILSSQ